MTEQVNKKTMSPRAKFGYMAAALIMLLLLFELCAFVKIFAYHKVEFGMDSLIDFLGLVITMSGSMLLLLVYAYFIGWRDYMSMRKFYAILVSMFIGYVLCIMLKEVGTYLMPLTFTAFILVSLVDKRDVLTVNTVISLIIYIECIFECKFTGITGEELDLLKIFGLGIAMGSVLVYYLSGAATRLQVFIRSLLIALINLELLYIWAMFSPDLDFSALVIPLLIVNFGEIIIAIVLQPLFESLFGILTNAKLQEITDHDAPLLKRLISEAPGTFNHCLSVASLAEVCAMSIGESALLTKACAYYHDMGKLTSPMYFSENQPSNENPHDNLLPEVSADILRRHTTYGYELCKRNKIPDEICNITIEHHGTLPMAVFYNKARQLTDSDVDIADYCYKGIVPQSKIAAIIMICDAAEAAIRSLGHPTADQVETLLNGIINDRIQRHQFDECSITMQDLNNIRETIKSAYGGLVHSRVRYPQGDSGK